MRVNQSNDTVETDFGFENVFMFYSACLTGLEDSNNVFCCETPTTNGTVFV